MDFLRVSTILQDFSDKSYFDEHGRTLTQNLD